MTSYPRGCSLEPEFCDVQLAAIVSKAADVVAFDVIETHRVEQRQDALFVCGKTKVQFPDSKHNCLPSQAVDLLPKSGWHDREPFFLLAGVMFAVARDYGITLRWGGDWNMDGVTGDQSFDDLAHFELISD